jgi:hypothetical protein
VQHVTAAHPVRVVPADLETVLSQFGRCKIKHCCLDLRPGASLLLLHILQDDFAKERVREGAIKRLLIRGTKGRLK